MNPQTYFDALNQEFLALSAPKEELFWTNFMGTTENPGALSEAETRLKAFVADPERLPQLRSQLAAAAETPASEDRERLLHGLRGWLHFFEVNAIESPVARELESSLIGDDADLFAKRKQLTLHYTDQNGTKTDASTLVLSTNLMSAEDEGVRKSSYDALLELERWVVEHGFIEMVARRNAFARAQGYRNYFDYKINVSEGMTPESLFGLLDDFEEHTREAQARGLQALSDRRGASALKPYNLNFARRGDTTRRMDPYLPFSQSLRRWVQSFGRMGVKFRNAELTLDLLDRKGKYENGFMHSPRPAWYDNGAWVPAIINFTSNANPGQTGSGERGLVTLFHEGGHAAHFSNITQNAPCFSQEFPPTSMAYAETQSMFFDSLLRDADWLSLYANAPDGAAMPKALIRDNLENEQPFAAYSERSMLVVPYFEWALYSAPEGSLTADGLIELARTTEKKLLGIESSPRPTLTIPHLLDKSSACSYHGYLLAHMAVYQTRAFFKQEYGYLTDNPRIGAQLSEHYWAPGNSASHDATLKSLTGEGFTARYLAAHCNRSVDEAWLEAEAAMAGAASRPRPPVQALEAAIRVVHGEELVADNRQSDSAMFEAFEAWVAARTH